MIVRLDHLVLTVQDVEATAHFYVTVLGMEKVIFGQDRVALKFGNQKINLHQAGKEIEPKANVPTPGSADICLITDVPIAEARERVIAQGVKPLGNIVPRTGATGPIQSFYFRDPDQNLIELSSYL